MNILSEQVKRFWQNMFLLEEADPLELVWGSFQWEASWAFVGFFLRGQKSFGGASCDAGMKGRWEEVLRMESLDGSAHGLLRIPPPPSPTSFL